LKAFGISYPTFPYVFHLRFKPKPIGNFPVVYLLLALTFKKLIIIMAKVFTDSNFGAEVLESNQVSVVDFWAEWCGPCRVVGPVVEELAKDYEGQAVIGKVNVDENPEITTKYGIRNIPTILFIKNGEVVDKQVGAVPKAVLEQKLKAHM
jgi:thioredoxin 1